MSEKNSTVLQESGWRRMPLGSEKLAGFGRALLYKLIRRGVISGKVIRWPGAKKGLIFVNIHELDNLVANAPDAKAVFTATQEVSPSAS